MLASFAIRKSIHINNNDMPVSQEHNSSDFHVTGARINVRLKSDRKKEPDVENRTLMDVTLVEILK